MEPRKRRKEDRRKHLNDQLDLSPKPQKKIRRKTKQQSWKRGVLKPSLVLLAKLFLVTTTLIVILQRRISNSIISDEGFLLRSKVTALLTHRRTRKHLLKHKDVYDQAYRLSNDDIPSNRSLSNKNYILKKEYGTNVDTCELTVLFMDPRLPTLGVGQPAWFALESVAAFAPNACILIQTSNCTIEKQFPGNVEAGVTQNIYSRSLPLFRGIIERGRVRVTYLDTKKYKLKSCDDFGNPSMAFMNRNYWKDEFIDGIDSEIVLIVQDDAVLCRPLDLEHLKSYAYIGAVWPREANILFPNPPEGMCVGMPIRWKSWLFYQRRWEIQQIKLEQNPHSIPKEDRFAAPSRLLSTAFQSPCGHGNAPVGNGGISMRNRTWLVEAIEACPHIDRAGFEVDHTNGCQVVDLINEDFYFGTVLRGIGAPLPNATVASMFAAEILLPEHVQRLYGTDIQIDTDIGNAEQIRFEGQTLTIPGAFHKPWWYLPNSLLRSPSMENACPFLGFLFKPEQSRWLEFKEETISWAGIGT